MNLSPEEAGDALADIQKMVNRTRRSVASSGAYIFLIITGSVWLVGYLSTQFLPGKTSAYIWAGASIAGTVLSILIGARRDRLMRRGPAAAVYTRRAFIFWALLVLYCLAAIAIARPSDGKQLTMFIILFVMIGQLSMGLLLSFSSTWWALPITALALAGYFWLPDYFYLWMALLVGGGMIVLGLYIRARW